MFEFTAVDGNSVIGLSSTAENSISSLGTSLSSVWTGQDLMTAFTTIAPLLVLGIVTGLVIGIVMHQIKKSKNKLGNAN